MIILDTGESIRVDGYQRIRVGFEWRVYPHQYSGGALSGLFGGDKPEAVDCDGSAILCDQEGVPLGQSYRDCCVYFDNQKAFSPWIVHHGDNLTGIGHGDDESISLFMDQIPEDVGRIIFTFDFFKAGGHRMNLGRMREVYIRLVDEEQEEELCRFDLTDIDTGAKALICGTLDRDDHGWMFTALGEPVDSKRYQYALYAKKTDELVKGTA